MKLILIILVLTNISCYSQGYIDSLERRMDKDKYMMLNLEQYGIELKISGKEDPELNPYILKVLSRMAINSNILKRYYIRKNDNMSAEYILNIQMRIIHTRNQLTVKCRTL